MIFFREFQKQILFAVVFFICFNLAFAEISFSSVNINENDEVLFALTHSTQASVEYSTIFSSKIQNGNGAPPRALTCFPERMEFFEDGKKLQVRNRFGRAVYDFGAGALQWKERAKSIPENFASPYPLVSSPKGDWYCYIERVDVFSGRLILCDAVTGKRVVIDQNCRSSYMRVPVKPSPSGKYFIYEKNNNVYFAEPKTLFRDLDIGEDARKIIPGSINAAVWHSDDFIVYINSDTVYSLSVLDLTPFLLYSKFLPIGKSLGTLPHSFDNANDRFWLSENGEDILVVRRDEMIVWCSRTSKFQSNPGYKTVYSSSFIEAGLTSLSFEGFWTASGEATVAARLSRAGTQSFGIYTIGSDGRMTRRIFVDDTHSDVSVSPDKKHLVILSGENILVYDTASWGLLYALSGEKAFSLAWRDNNTLCIGGERSVKMFSVDTGASKFLFASSGQSAWWLGRQIVLQNDVGELFSVEEASGLWKELETAKDGEIYAQNKTYRVYAGSTPNPMYKNALYIRTLRNEASTRPLIAQSASPRPNKERAALVFDADLNADGLSAFLAICKEYNLKCTFFFNGEFIQGFPTETRRIVEAGHECAAIFFNSIDLTDRRVYGDKQFISKGLARLEDEFLDCTGKELSLYWHAPFHKADAKIKEEGRAAGYTYIDFKNPKIVPIAASKNEALSNSAFYEKTTLFMHELFSTGAELVTVSGLGKIN